MTPDVGNPIWGIAVVVLPIILGIALVYGLVNWSRRSRSPQATQIKVQATERVYREADREERQNTAP